MGVHHLTLTENYPHGLRKAFSFQFFFSASLPWQTNVQLSFGSDLMLHNTHRIMLLVLVVVAVGLLVVVVMVSAVVLVFVFVIMLGFSYAHLLIQVLIKSVMLIEPPNLTSACASEKADMKYIRWTPLGQSPAEAGRRAKVTTFQPPANYPISKESLHYWLRPIRRGQFGFANFAPHFDGKFHIHFLIHWVCLYPYSEN